jgi:hypothetical protein
MATAQLVGERIAPRVAVVLAAMADMGNIQLRRTQLHPTPHQEAAEVAA